MMKILFYLLLAYCMVCSCQTKQVKKTPILPLEQSDYRKLTTNAEMIAYLEMASNFSEMINIEILDSTISGKRIPLIWLGTKGEKNNSKPSLLFFAQQHGNEPSGKEGLLLLINEFALGRHLDLLENVNLFIIPQTNPDGGDKNERRNSDGIDLNRDHLLFQSNEARLVQKVFDEYQPEVVVDIHEYYPYSEEWDKFGYSRNIDIQFGGPTNINIDSGIQKFFYTTAFPEVKQQVEKDGYSFFEYTLGYLPEGERLRRSTVDINDGRQSLGITNTIAFI
ncbi:MAG: M14 family zinc carboxypeptidase, partial [Bacteroidales bacterium]|nr:M14 family zinc carboxypeptidase [Bacteroidales bacterium]